jgi:NagD protein
MTEREINYWLMDMDGVLIREEERLDGAPEFVAKLRELEIPFLVLTNSSIYTRRDLGARLARQGLDVREESIWTSALATATFLEDQRPGGSAFIVGEAGLTTALHEAGYTVNEQDPDYVVLGETRTYSFERITQAIRLIRRGARFIATNPDNIGPAPGGPLPATGSVAALISRATGVDPYFVGKPNPLMIRSALNALDAHSEQTAMVGDRMDTDIVAGIGRARDVPRPHRGDRPRRGRVYRTEPHRIVDSVADLIPEVEAAVERQASVNGDLAEALAETVHVDPARIPGRCPSSCTARPSSRGPPSCSPARSAWRRPLGDPERVLRLGELGGVAGRRPARGVRVDHRLPPELLGDPLDEDPDPRPQARRGHPGERRLGVEDRDQLALLQRADRRDEDVRLDERIGPGVGGRGAAREGTVVGADADPR